MERLDHGGVIGVTSFALLGHFLEEGVAIVAVVVAGGGQLGAEIGDELRDGAGGGLPGVPAEDGGGGEVAEAGDGRVGSEGDEGGGGEGEEEEFHERVSG